MFKKPPKIFILMFLEEIYKLKLERFYREWGYKEPENFYSVVTQIRNQRPVMHTEPEREESGNSASRVSRLRSRYPGIFRMLIDPFSVKSSAGTPEHSSGLASVSTEGTGREEINGRSENKNIDSTNIVEERMSGSRSIESKDDGMQGYEDDFEDDDENAPVAAPVAAPAPAPAGPVSAVIDTVADAASAAVSAVGAAASTVLDVTSAAVSAVIGAAASDERSSRSLSRTAESSASASRIISGRTGSSQDDAPKLFEADEEANVGTGAGSSIGSSFSLNSLSLSQSRNSDSLSGSTESKDDDEVVTHDEAGQYDENERSDEAGREADEEDEGEEGEDERDEDVKGCESFNLSELHDRFFDRNIHFYLVKYMKKIGLLSDAEKYKVDDLVLYLYNFYLILDTIHTKIENNTEINTEEKEFIRNKLIILSKINKCEGHIIEHDKTSVLMRAIQDIVNIEFSENFDVILNSLKKSVDDIVLLKKVILSVYKVCFSKYYSGYDHYELLSVGERILQIRDPLREPETATSSASVSPLLPVPAPGSATATSSVLTSPIVTPMTSSPILVSTPSTTSSLSTSPSPLIHVPTHHKPHIEKRIRKRFIERFREEDGKDNEVSPVEKALQAIGQTAVIDFVTGTAFGRTSDGRLYSLTYDSDEKPKRVYYDGTLDDAVVEVLQENCFSTHARGPKQCREYVRECILSRDGTGKEECVKDVNFGRVQDFSKLHPQVALTQLKNFGFKIKTSKFGTEKIDVVETVKEWEDRLRSEKPPSQFIVNFDKRTPRQKDNAREHLAVLVKFINSNSAILNKNIYIKKDIGGNETQTPVPEEISRLGIKRRIVPRKGTIERMKHDSLLGERNLRTRMLMEGGAFPTVLLNISTDGYGHVPNYSGESNIKLLRDKLNSAVGLLKSRGKNVHPGDIAALHAKIDQVERNEQKLMKYLNIIEAYSKTVNEFKEEETPNNISVDQIQTLIAKYVAGAKKHRYNQLGLASIITEIINRL